MSVEVLVKNSCETTGEGPHWDERTQTLYYVDIICGDAHKYDPATGEDSKLHFDKTISFIVPRKSGGFALGHGREIILTKSWSNSGYEVVADVDQGTDNRFNDAKCDPAGRLWAGTMGDEKVPANPERQMGTLYCLDADRKLTGYVTKIDISNGLAWTKDRRTMYYIDSFPRKIYAFDYDHEKGTIANQRVAIDFGGAETLSDTGYPDGMCIDENDNIWVACYSVGKVICFNPSTGERLREITFPAKRTTSCCFGGKNYDEMFVTCGKFGMTEDEFKNEQPLAGSVFKVTGLGVKGFPAPVYEG